VKSPKPPKPPAPVAVTTANSADVAQDSAAARKKTRDRYDFSKTLLRGQGMQMQDGIKTTLG
jgi:hypothetical protein